MAVSHTIKTSNDLVYARVVLHGAGAQRIHAQVDSVIPRRETREVANDFNFADFRHVSQIFTLRRTQQLGGIYLRDIERRQLPGCFSGRRFFEDQALILADVARGFARHVLHRATSSASAAGSPASLSANMPTAVSIALRVVISVQHHSAALPNSGKNLRRGSPPTILCPSRRLLMTYGSSCVCTTNSLKRGATENSTGA